MSWIELSLDTTNEAVDWVCTLLAKNNVTTDVHIKRYTEADSEKITPDWAFTISFYIPDDIYADIHGSEIAQLLAPLQRTGLTTHLAMAVVADKPTDTELASSLIHRIGQKFVIVSAETAYSSTPEEIILRLKTSLAFGSGLHPATILSLQLLERHITPVMNVLDLGSGSGILSVAIAKLGANVLALDNDIIAVEATKDAVYRNGVEQQVTVKQGSLGCGSDLGHWLGGDSISNVPKIDVQNQFNLIVANIPGRIHIALAADYQKALRSTDSNGGLVILAGFTNDYEEDLAVAFTELGFENVDCERQNEWVALAYRLKSKSCCGN
ncbi:50S ribosomal protein L11 methyltransferase [Tolypothrix sp. FACHB-123]|uniref:50S ribosomal protein L11 methyltransferase n=1 Tax=Tolypothrix sp. FACHB-123 TaxID=2692868 RepID=UPI001684BD29|nr:50S ribosomal protein L11 methyltransferase [Tolypothrix sp. FACHB-123]MBD2353582.1 50S ribosomal protein L11 methyltransferase [Tolypothrix sp. FACHB-123]